MDVFLVLKLDIFVFHIHHPCGFREYLGIIEKIMLSFNFIAFECLDFVNKSIVIELAC